MDKSKSMIHKNINTKMIII